MPSTPQGVRKARASTNQTVRWTHIAAWLVSQRINNMYAHNGQPLDDLGATSHSIKDVKLDERCGLEPESPSWLVSEKQLNE